MGSKTDPYRYGKLSDRGHYGALMKASDAVVAAALARVARRPTRRLPGHGTRYIIEYRRGAGVEIRSYAVPPMRQPIMADVRPWEYDPRFNPRFVRPSRSASRPATAGDGGADAPATTPAASVPAVDRTVEGSGETSRPGPAAGHSQSPSQPQPQEAVA